MDCVYVGGWVDLLRMNKRKNLEDGKIGRTNEKDILVLIYVLPQW